VRRSRRFKNGHWGAGLAVFAQIAHNVRLLKKYLLSVRIYHKLIESKKDSTELMPLINHLRVGMLLQLFETTA
jgi:hypothetical protein